MTLELWINPQRREHQDVPPEHPRGGRGQDGLRIPAEQAAAHLAGKNSSVATLTDSKFTIVKSNSNILKIFKKIYI